jgi:hypothetical protein
VLLGDFAEIGLLPPVRRGRGVNGSVTKRLALSWVKALTDDVKITFQITGSLAFALWATVLFIPGASSGSRSMLTDLVSWLAGDVSSSHSDVVEFLILSGVLLGYGIYAFREASRRE